MSSEAKAPAQLGKKLEVRIKDGVYDVSDFVHKHPGGNVIVYATAFKDEEGVPDVTEAFVEFHGRSRTAEKFLKALPRRPATCKREELLERFAEWRAQLAKEGFFDPSPAHIAYRVVELVVMFAVGLGLFAWGGVAGVLLGVLVHGLFGARCGWLQHEGGHNSLTGNVGVDKFIQKVFIGFGLCCSGSMWNGMHDKHHATPQKIGFDMDLDTTPLVAFFKTAVEDNRPRGFFPRWIRWQHLTFLPATSGVFVMLFWIFYLHPRHVVRTGDVTQLFFMLLAHTVRPWAIAAVTGWSFASCYALLWASLWVSGVYLFGHFSTSHTHTEVVEQDQHKNWVEFALNHTVDINPNNPLINWTMGYLNCQVLHHLFPHMPQFRQPEVSRRLVKFCKDNGLRYEIVGYAEAWRRTFANLRDVGLHYHTHGLSKERLANRPQDVGGLLKSLKRANRAGVGA